VARLGSTDRLSAILAAALSFYGLYWVVAIVEAQFYRTSFLLVALVLVFLGAGVRSGTGETAALPTLPLHSPSPFDIVLAGFAVAALGWPLVDHTAFPYRAATPTTVDLVLGVVTIALVLEATRRTTGWVLPVTAALFILYAYLGPLFDLIGLGLIAHRGYYADRLVGTLYMTLDGIFGVPLEVAATYIVLFSVYGAILEHSGAGRFFIDWSLAAMGRSRSPAAPGRSVTVAGFLLGTVSGSGVATTVTLGSVAWPILRRAGYSADTSGAVLSAAGIGALLSPPTLGAAAFLIAEFLEISYLQVLVMSTIPMLLYYLSAFLMMEGDSRRLGTRAVDVDVLPLGTLTRRYGYHFLSLIVVAALMAGGVTAFRAVVWATVLAVGMSFLRAETALTPRRLFAALAAGGRSTLSVAATTATAGIIVGVIGLTGLGLKLAGLIVTLAGGSLALTVVYAALAVWLLGLAVPVTASYIIAAVTVAPALTQVGVPAVAAHMFIFYYAVLSEVSPPTALSPFAAAAITGGNPMRTTVLTWKYTLPAFVVPFAFTLAPEGLALLLRAPVVEVLRVTLTTALGIAGLAIAFGGWLRGPVPLAPRALAGIAGATLIHPARTASVVGIILLSTAIVWQIAMHKQSPRAPNSAGLPSRDGD
jgi:TRAP transporter 4TM/12TM fusion protein